MSASDAQFRKRSAILACLRQMKQHPCAEELYQRLQTEHQDISRATVYRNLALFRDQGLIVSLGTVGGVERFDGELSPHDHFVCSVCSCVQDLPRVSIPPEAMEEAAQGMGCRIDGYRLIFAGVCQNCLPNKNEKVH